MARESSPDILKGFLRTLSTTSGEREKLDLSIEEAASSLGFKRPPFGRELAMWPKQFVCWSSLGQLQ